LSTADHPLVGYQPWLNTGSAQWLRFGSARTPCLLRAAENGSDGHPQEQRSQSVASKQTHGCRIAEQSRSGLATKGLNGKPPHHQQESQETPKFFE
ncbi:hypothetical protein, partial [Aquabacterium commune]|uniref:hypothetical protein n=1 Tax=Aquabacterium commune TaxID=70586 RepID=UPI001AAC7DFF